MKMAVLAAIDDERRERVRWVKKMFEKIVEFGGWKVCFCFFLFVCFACVL